MLAGNVVSARIRHPRGKKVHVRLRRGLSCVASLKGGVPTIGKGNQRPPNLIVVCRLRVLSLSLLTRGPFCLKEHEFLLRDLNKHCIQPLESKQPSPDNSEKKEACWRGSN